MDNSVFFTEIWCSYRRTILHSIVTSFGLDFLVNDRMGGDVDTIHGVRENGTYKNRTNETLFEKNDPYDERLYHRDESYESIVREARDSQLFIEDAYVPGNHVFYGKSSYLVTPSEQGTNHRANLDHVISAKEIHDDPGRILAQVDGVTLANDRDNLRFTNEHLNKSMGSKSIEEYIQWREDKGNPIPDSTRDKMLEENRKARESYEDRIAEAYYSSDRFLLDSTNAAMQRGFEMGLRQALGLIFVEMWFACEDNMKKLPGDLSFKECTQAIANGIKTGFQISCQKYKKLLSQFGQGFVAGSLASLTTTLINIFVTTDKNTARYIRQAYVTIVQVGDVLLINPDDLRLGDQLKSATVTLGTGASIIAGTAVGNRIAETSLGRDKHVGYILQNFCAALVSGLISCTFLIMLDRSKFISELVKKMNMYGDTSSEIHQTSDMFIRLAAQVSNYDISVFQGELEALNEKTNLLLHADDDEVHEILLDMLESLDISLPWEGDFDSFMNDNTKHLVFE